MRKYRITESRLRDMIREAVKRSLMERSDDYEGNDLDYDTIKMEAEDVIYRMRENGEDIWWRKVAEEMGFRLETLNGDDMELLKDAIEEVMFEEEESNPHWNEDLDFEFNIHNLKHGN